MGNLLKMVLAEGIETTRTEENVIIRRRKGVDRITENKFAY